MRFRMANSIYVYGIAKKTHFANQSVYVGGYGVGKTHSGRDTIPVRNYGIEPRDWQYEEYDPRHEWYQLQIQRFLQKFPKKQRRHRYGLSWDLLNFHAHTIQRAFRRFVQ